MAERSDPAKETKMIVDCSWPCSGHEGPHQFQFGQCSGPFPILVEVAA